MTMVFKTTNIQDVLLQYTIAHNRLAKVNIQYRIINLSELITFYFDDKIMIKS